MEIEVNNFRSHIKGKWIFGKGVTLLTGKSGSGKSTILEAIAYALWGNIRKPYTFGTKTCRVKLRIVHLNLQIIRTSSPNRLIVTGDKEYEDSDAQAFINRVLGMTHEEYNISSYIAQKSGHSILTSSVADQIKISRTLTFSPSKGLEDKHNNIVKGLKDKKKTISVELDKTIGKIEYINNEIDTIREVDEPEITLDKIDNLKIKIRKYEERRCKLEDKLNKINIELNEIERKKEDTEHLKSEYKKVQSNIKQVKNDIDNCEEPLDEEEIERIDNKLKDLEKASKYWNTTHHRLEQYTEELRALKKEITSNKKELKMYSSVDNTDKEDDDKGYDCTIEDAFEKKQYLQSLKGKIQRFEDVKKKATSFLSKSRTPSSITKNLVKYKNKLEEKIKKLEEKINLNVAYPCPSCKTKLVYTGLEGDGGLAIPKTDVIDSETLNKSRDIVKKHKNNNILISEILDKIPDISNEEADKSLEDVDEEIEEINNVIEKLKEKERAQIERETKILSLKRNIKNKTTRHDELYEEYDKIYTDEPTISKEKCNNLLRKYRSLLDRQDQVSKLWERLNTQYKNLRMRLKDANIKIRTNEEDISEYDALKEKSEIYTEKLETLYDCMTRISTEVENGKIQWDAYNNYRNKLKNLQGDLKDTRNMKEKLETQLQSIITLIELAKEAEIKTIRRLLENVSNATNAYIEPLFTDYENINGTSNSEGGCPYINITADETASKIQTILYNKGYKYDTFKQLSGGEFDRILLANVLAINNILNSPFLFLDECLSSLDIESNSNIITFLRDVFCKGDKPKIIIICSHQAIEGIFDNVYDVSAPSIEGVEK